uniref:Kinesin-like protein KIF2A-like N-terminal domain-containing protein n=1 Tax=Anopheles minimus TaxID=112268 RepID=A0A182W526_9DIPT
MLWFKKRLSTLFGGSKRSAKREELSKGPGAEENVSGSASSITAATGCSSTVVSGNSSDTAVNASKHPKPTSIRQKKNSADSNLPCDQCTRGKQCRIHTAIVSRFHEATRSVTVEWYERGESKGKEIEIDMLLELNKKQPQQQQQQQQLEPLTEEINDLQHQMPAPANLAR